MLEMSGNPGANLDPQPFKCNPNTFTKCNGAERVSCITLTTNGI